ncbi:MAG: hypothetical protein LBP33_12505 [Candidatus Adiutrix sp.]|jgi:hypothetical protein|nr:hypothetical protein [Candidatus Adiutrix sp.]
MSILQTLHSYLVRPGLWEISGRHYDRHNNAYPQRGRLVVTHEPDLWIIETELTITTEETQTLHSRCEVQPLAPGATHTEWKSETGGPEPVFGLFVLVEDSLMSPWQSRSGDYWGQEMLVQVGPKEYRGRGFAFLRNEKVFAWSTRLVNDS